MGRRIAIEGTEMGMGKGVLVRTSFHEVLGRCDIFNRTCAALIKTVKFTLIKILEQVGLGGTEKPG